MERNVDNCIAGTTARSQVAHGTHVAAAEAAIAQVVALQRVRAARVAAALAFGFAAAFGGMLNLRGTKQLLIAWQHKRLQTNGGWSPARWVGRFLGG